MADREAAVYQAKLAKQAERFDDMAEAMKSVALLDMELTREEGNLLYLAYANKMVSRQLSVTKLQSIKLHQDKAVYRHYAVEYIRKVEQELSGICEEFTSILKEHVIPSCNSHEDRVYYFKMMGDTYFYHAGDARISAAEKSLSTYQLAMTIAKKELRDSNPIRLALALNLAVLQYSMLDSPERAFEIAEDAIVNALQTIVDEESPESSLEIIIILKNHLFLWHFRLLEKEGFAAEVGNNGGADQVVSEFLHLHV